MENLTEPITKDLDFQLQDPFLLYRNARRKKKDTHRHTYVCLLLISDSDTICSKHLIIC